MSRVAVIGSWRVVPDSDHYVLAKQIGASAAYRGHRVATGGYSGIMAAALEGAREAGGEAEAFTCKALTTILPVSAAATSIREFGSIAERAGALLGQSQACIVFPGRTGTAAELALAVEARAKGELDCPVVLIGEFWRGFFRWLESSNSSLVLSRDSAGTDDLFVVASDLEGVNKVLDQL